VTVHTLFPKIANEEGRTHFTSKGSFTYSTTFH